MLVDYAFDNVPVLAYSFLCRLCILFYIHRLELQLLLGIKQLKNSIAKHQAIVFLNNILVIA
jgi:hypothetical protein